MNLKTNPSLLYPCMFCKNTKFKKLGHVQKTKMMFGTCKQCKLTQTYMRWSDSDFQKYYSSGQYLKKASMATDPNEWHYKYALKHRKRTIEEIKKHITKKDKILEFGCSVGALVYMLKDYDVLGVDIDLNAIKFGQNKKINVEVMDILKTKRKFDVIYSSHVFEHLNNPAECINKLSGLLTTNGKLIIVVPSFLTSLEWANTPHIVYYQASTLQNFFVNKKWKVNEINTFNKWKTKFWFINKTMLYSSYHELILVATKTEQPNSMILKSDNYHLRLIKTKLLRLCNKVYGFLFIHNK